MEPIKQKDLSRISKFKDQSSVILPDITHENLQVIVDKINEIVNYINEKEEQK